MKFLKQYKNMILLAVAIVLIIGIIAMDPLGMIAKRRHERAEIRNRIAIEEAETAKRIALIQAEREAELIRIHQGLGSVSAGDNYKPQIYNSAGDGE